MNGTEAEHVDVVFELAGPSVPAEHAWPLWRALLVVLPWLEDEAGVGVHPLRTSPTGYGAALLARRARLVLRVPRGIAGRVLALSDNTLDVEGHPLAVGAGSPRALQAWGTLHSPRVATGNAEASAFHDDVACRLRELGIACEFISGRRRTVAAGGRAEVIAYSLVLHGVGPADSLRLQYKGIGSHRSLGCGILVPHKSIAAVA